jgi:CRISPR-associated protein Csd2
MSQLFDPTKKFDFELIVEVSMGNPNGDPDQDNAPRQNFETDKGITSDASTKRKIRNFIDDYFSDKDGYDIFVKEDITLNKKIESACDQLGITFKNDKDKISKVHGQDKEDAVRNLLLKTYWDLRMFGAVLTTGRDAGQVRGPIQIGIGQSVKAIAPQELTISRKAITKEEDAGNQGTFGKKWVVPHAVYRIRGHYNPNDGVFGRKATGITQEDLEIFFTAMKNMYENDRSASRGLMTLRGLYVFTHECKFGNAPAQVLFESIKIDSDVETPASFEDYKITFPETLPEGVTLNVMVG